MSRGARAQQARRPGAARPKGSRCRAAPAAAGDIRIGIVNGGHRGGLGKSAHRGTAKPTSARASEACARSCTGDHSTTRRSSRLQGINKRCVACNAPTPPRRRASCATRAAAGGNRAGLSASNNALKAVSTRASCVRPNSRIRRGGRLRARGAAV